MKYAQNSTDVNKINLHIVLHRRMNALFQQTASVHLSVCIYIIDTELSTIAVNKTYIIKSRAGEL